MEKKYFKVINSHKASKEAKRQVIEALDKGAFIPVYLKIQGKITKEAPETALINVFTSKKEDEEASSLVGAIRGADHKSSVTEDGYEYADATSLREAIENKWTYRIVGTRNSGMSFILEATESKKASERKKTSTATAEEIEKTLIKDEIISKEKMERITSLLEDFYSIKRGTPLYNGIISLIRRQPEGKEIAEPKTLYRVNGRNNLVKNIFIHLISGNNIILQGNKSVGKNVAWETIGYILNRKIITLKCQNNMTYSEIFGHQSTDLSGTAGINDDNINETVDTIFTKKKSANFKKVLSFIKSLAFSMSPKLKLEAGAVTEALLHAKDGYGTILLLDEMNLSNPNVLAGAINGIADGHTEEIYVTGLGNIPIDRSNLILGATQNYVGGDYAGTQTQNEATVSRFVNIDIENTASIEKVLRTLEDEISLDDEVYFALDKCWGKFSDLVEMEVSEACLNLRGFMASARAISNGMDYAQALKDGVVHNCPREDWESLEIAIEQTNPSTAEEMATPS